MLDNKAEEQHFGNIQLIELLAYITPLINVI